MNQQFFMTRMFRLTNYIVSYFWSYQDETFLDTNQCFWKCNQLATLLLQHTRPSKTTLGGVSHKILSHSSKLIQINPLKMHPPWGPVSERPLNTISGCATPSNSCQKVSHLRRLKYVLPGLTILINSVKYAAATIFLSPVDGNSGVTWQDITGCPGHHLPGRLETITDQSWNLGRCLPRWVGGAGQHGCERC